MGSSRKHRDKERDRDVKEKQRSRSRSKSKERSDKCEKSTHRSSHRHKDKDKEAAIGSRKRPKTESCDDERADKRVDKKAKVKEVTDLSKTSNSSVNKNVKLDQKSSEESDRTDRKDNQQNKDDVVRNEPSNTESLSIEETNKLRAKLGLKPLDVNDSEDKSKDDKMKTIEVFVKTENISQKQEAEKIKERLEIQRNKRKIVEKLKRVKGLADSDGEDDVSSWVSKNRQIQEEKARAQKRAQLLEEMEEEFGVSSLIEEDNKKKKDRAYSSKDLRGLTVGHKSDDFKEGHQMVLTLQDKEVLAEDEDVLVNVDLVDQERTDKNLENKTKRPEYRPYDEPEFDEFGILKPKTLLAKYDEELEGPKKNSFKLGVNATDRANELEMIRIKLKQEEGRISLTGPKSEIAKEYYTEEEMIKFRKPKKVRKMLRKKIKTVDESDTFADLTASSDHGSRRQRNNEQVDANEVAAKEEPMDGIKPDIKPDISSTSSSKRAILLDPMDIDHDYNPMSQDLSGVVLEEDEADRELQTALHKARKLKQRDNIEATTGAASIVKVAQTVSSLRNGDEDCDHSSDHLISSSIILNSTAEFCRNLGDIPTYGLAGNRDEEDLEVEMEQEMQEERTLESEPKRGQWNEVEVNEDDVPQDLDGPGQPILEEEPDVSKGLAGALQLAMKKGYLDKEVKKQMSSARQSVIQAQSYTIEEKFYEDDKIGRRERYSGPVSEFREKYDYKPDIKLDYVDEKGRVLDQKEAFRYLSHKFHGKGPSKNKIDKRMKKKDQESKLRQMSSTDTPLNTLKMLTDKQRELQTPYVVLTGAHKTGIQASISKSK